MKIKWGDLYTLLIAGLVFVTPLNLFLKFAENEAYVGGLFVDYLIPKFFVSDILILFIFSCWLLEHFNFIVSGKALQEIKKRTQKAQVFIGATSLTFVLFVARQLVVEKPFIAIIQLLHMVAFIGLLLVIQQQRKVLFKSSLVAWSFLSTILFQSSIGLYQFIFQRSLTPYHVFGETQLSQVSGISKLNLQGALYIAPYGTTSHPNILAGILVFYMLIAYIFYQTQPKSTLKTIAFISALLAGTLTVALTFSVSAWLALMIAILISILPNYWKIIMGWGSAVLFIATPFLLHIFQWLTQTSSLSITRRIMLNATALEMWLGNVFMGVGLQHFTVFAEKYASVSSNEVVRFLQPVHHLGLLWLSETGMLGILVAVLLTIFFKFRNTLTLTSSLVTIAPLVPIASLDHYLFTSHAGWLLVVWWISILSWNNKQFILRK